jgi:hypothetical protein
MEVYVFEPTQHGDKISREIRQWDVDVRDGDKKRKTTKSRNERSQVDAEA